MIMISLLEWPSKTLGFPLSLSCISINVVISIIAVLFVFKSRRGYTKSRQTKCSSGSSSHRDVLERVYSGKTIVITGASSGIGRSMATLLASVTNVK